MSLYYSDLFHINCHIGNIVLHNPSKEYIKNTLRHPCYLRSPILST